MLQPTKFSLTKDEEAISLIGRALSSPVRLAILKQLTVKSVALKELADKLEMPLNTLLKHVSELEKAGLIVTQVNYTSKGKERRCYRATDNVSVDLTAFAEEDAPPQTVEEHSISLGSYFDFHDLASPCGMATAKESVNPLNDISVFLSSKRTRAQIIWFSQGLLEYRVPLPSGEKLKKLKGIEVSFEACSESPFYNNNYKSDISVFINEKRIGVYSSSGDYGDRKGFLNPDFWKMGLTQYGKFLLFKIGETQTSLNDEFLSYVKLPDLRLDAIKKNYLTLKIGVEPSAKHVGGINLFGKGFGDYKQDILFKYLY